MMWPPSVLQVKVKKESRNISLWFPLFVIWPFLALAALALAPIVVTLAVLFWWTGWGKPMLYSFPLFYSMFCALRGLRVDVQQPNQHVYISIN